MARKRSGADVSGPYCCAPSGSAHQAWRLMLNPDPDGSFSASQGGTEGRCALRQADRDHLVDSRRGCSSATTVLWLPELGLASRYRQTPGAAGRSPQRLPGSYMAHRDGHGIGDPIWARSQSGGDRPRCAGLGQGDMAGSGEPWQWSALSANYRGSFCRDGARPEPLRVPWRML